MDKLYIYADSFGAYTKNWESINPGKRNSGVNYHRSHHAYSYEFCDEMYEQCWPDLLADHLRAKIGNIGVIGASPLFTLHTWIRDWELGSLTDDHSDVYIFIWSQSARMVSNKSRPPMDLDDVKNRKNYRILDESDPDHDALVYTMQAWQDLKVGKEERYWRTIYNQKVFQHLVGTCPAQPLKTIRNAVQLHLWAFPEEVPFCWHNDMAPTPAEMRLDQYSILRWMRKFDPDVKTLVDELKRKNDWLEPSAYDGLSNHMSPNCNALFANYLLSLIQEKQQKQLRTEDQFRYW
jgi:hypothetical protein